MVHTTFPGWAESSNCLGFSEMPPKVQADALALAMNGRITHIALFRRDGPVDTDRA
jgi:hypothetical protein